MLKRTVAATLNPQLIEETIDGFPQEGRWKIDSCCDFKTHVRAKGLLRVNWRATTCAIPDSAGLYAFLFPVKKFQPLFTIRLHGPTQNGKSKQIPLEIALRP
jgi:hypothetical protein